MEEINKNGKENTQDQPAAKEQPPASEQQQPAAAKEKPASETTEKETSAKKPTAIIAVLGAVTLVVTIFFLIAAIKASGAKKEAFRLKSDIKKLRQDMSEKEADFKVQLDEAAAAKDAVDKKLAELTEVNKKLELKVREAGKYVEVLKEDLRSQRKDILTELNEFISGSKKAEQSLMDKIDALNSMNEELQKNIKDLSYIAKVKPEEIREMADAIALDKIVVAPGEEQEKEIAPSYSGKVLNVNDRYDFAVIDIGEEHGVKQGSKLSVMRKKNKIAELIVKETYAHMSLANIIKGKIKANVKKGDDVIFIP